MKWIITTCDASKHIRPVQEWLFKKYAPNADLHYIDLRKNDIEKWGREVRSFIPNDAFLIFGLDDYLPTAPLQPERLVDAMGIIGMYDLDRFEFGYGAHNKEPFMKGKQPFVDHGIWLAYSTITPYSVSCQFAIWNTETLRKILSMSSSPWNFELKHSCWAGCFPKGQEAFRWIEESALSKRWIGRINVNGLPAEDVNELIKLGLLDESKLINRTHG